MNTLLLTPADTLFFRDGRPMSGSLSGHGAAWPLPTVPSAAMHAALHRAALSGAHKHVPGRSSQTRDYSEENRKQHGRLFGSLVTAGPFPVGPDGGWFFPRPADAQKPGSTLVTHRPTPRSGASSQPLWLECAAGNTQAPSKETPEPWWSRELWTAYLNGHDVSRPTSSDRDQLRFATDATFSDAEHSIGIGISPETGTQDGDRIYSAHSLRLRPGWRLGLLAEAIDKIDGDATGKRDLIAELFPGGDAHSTIVVGGQQRLCSVLRERPSEIPLPQAIPISGTRIKWVLLTPAIFPLIEADPTRGITAHRGGWLPNWIAESEQSVGGERVEAGSVLLLDGPGKVKAKRKHVPPGRRIDAKLVAAIVGKPVPVAGYALPNEADADRALGGAASTHLAVPAGSVYYFEAASDAEAGKLAAALNWHGSAAEPGATTTIRNRRSTLFGEKGFGIGLCGRWELFP
jgi:CRISPR-associated protein Cmr3